MAIKFFALHCIMYIRKIWQLLLSIFPGRSWSIIIGGKGYIYVFAFCPTNFF